MNAPDREPPELSRVLVLRDADARQILVTTLRRWSWSLHSLEDYRELAHDQNRAIGSILSVGEVDHLAALMQQRETPPVVAEIDPVTDTELVPVKSLAERVIGARESGGDPGVDPGWKTLAKLYRPRRGEWTLVTGIPGAGKSSLVDCLMLHLAKVHGWKFAIFSAENLPIERHVASLAEKLVHEPLRPGPTARMSESVLKAALAWLDEHVAFIVPHESAVTLTRVLAIAKEAVARRGICGLVIDPWNELDHTRPPGTTETEHVSRSLSLLRRFARVYQVHVWLVAHPTKLQKRPDGSYPVPTPYDVSGSAHFRNKADNALSVYRNERDATALTEIYVQKIRFRETGQIGMAEVKYNPVTGGFD